MGLDTDAQVHALEVVRTALRERDRATAALKQKSAELADALTDARAAGVGVNDLVEATHLSRQGVYYIMARYGVEDGSS